MLCIPAEIREEIGDIAILRRTPHGYLLLSGKKEDFMEEFRKVITSEPRRKGKPTLLSPDEMKVIWRTKV
jgi:hypothetical protein